MCSSNKMITAQQSNCTAKSIAQDGDKLPIYHAFGTVRDEVAVISVQGIRWRDSEYLLKYRLFFDRGNAL